ncbi:MAG TPA: 4-(cytidine 5'-diphospho)-2-C-methyl-D-erythritol kinase [Syntrophorhabdaceae bacterium]|nr:4-(cytidine 5'-diphospho)-2-C-methyl-D-erythritol kinase [Syntrophorhabdaceae bacterium]
MKNNNESIKILSPAKVNLFLKVISKRDDGYHNIVSIVDIITLYDRITIKPLPDDRIVVEDDKSILPKDNSNTVYRAANMLKERYSIKKGAFIFVEKNIPIGSGLGGPSSNAVSTIKGLFNLWNLNADKEELFELVKKIGADCPLFLYGKPCRMEGIGDVITPVEIPKLIYVIVYPKKALSTKDVYNKVKIVLTKNKNDIKLIEKFKTTEDVIKILHNDLEKAAIDMFPELKSIKEILIKEGAMGSIMSGSGSSVFGIFDDIEKAKRAMKNLDNLGSIFFATSLN